MLVDFDYEDDIGGSDDGYNQNDNSLFPPVNNKNLNQQVAADLGRNSSIK